MELQYRHIGEQGHNGTRPTVIAAGALALTTAVLLSSACTVAQAPDRQLPRQTVTITAEPTPLSAMTPVTPQKPQTPLNLTAPGCRLDKVALSSTGDLIVDCIAPAAGHYEMTMTTGKSSLTLDHQENVKLGQKLTMSPTKAYPSVCTKLAVNVFRLPKDGTGRSLPVFESSTCGQSQDKQIALPLPNPVVIP